MAATRATVSLSRAVTAEAISPDRAYGAKRNLICTLPLHRGCDPDRGKDRLSDPVCGGSGTRA